MRTLSSISMLLAAALLTAGCETEDPTNAVVDNAYPDVSDGGTPSAQIVVYKVWWVTTIFLDPVVPIGESAQQRTVPASDYAYAILAPGWDPTSGHPPSVLIPVRSNDKLSVGRGDTLHIAVSDASFTGNCAAGKPLAQADADFITQSIFPGDFATVTYDAKTCMAKPLPSGGGASDVSAPDAAIVD